MKPLSLKARVSICIAFVMFVVVIILSTVAYYEFHEALLETLDVKLQADTSRVKHLLFSNDPFDAKTRKQLDTFLIPVTGSERTDYQIWFENGDEGSTEGIVSADLYAILKQKNTLPPDPDKFLLSELKQKGRMYRIIWARYSIPSDFSQAHGILNIIFATSSKHAYHEFGEFARVLIILGGIVLWITVGLAQWALRWGLKPVALLSERMSHISDKNLNELNYEYSGTPRELLPFVKSWEAMLNRLSDAMADQKRFTSDAAHELKTPIALIKSTLQLAQSKKREVAFYEDTITHALEDVDRLNALVSQLLELSCLENAESSSEREIINIQELIEEITESYKPFLDEGGFCLNQCLTFAEMKGNRPQIRRLFGNLIDNAIKYAPPQTTITVSMDVSPETISVTVHDEGGSIPENECDLLFNRFYRISKARNRNSGGSGLGLAIAKEIAVLHSGDIRVESNQESGTRFIVTLPKVNED